MDKTEINQELNYNECYITLYSERERDQCLKYLGLYPKLSNQL